MTVAPHLREAAAAPPEPLPDPAFFNGAARAGQSACPRIVIVGGGAGGLELATRLGDRFGRRGRASIVLVDRAPSHLWTPLLHEVAAGSMDANTHSTDYVAQARWHHFEFQQGELCGLDRSARQVSIKAVVDEDGEEVLPPRALAYDTLVLAIGSMTNFFGVPGAEQHAMSLDAVSQAERFRRRLISACMRAQTRLDKAPGERARVDVVIIGAGATGVELSAELRNTAKVFGAYGLHRLDGQNDVRLTIVEAGPRILAPLPERVALGTAKLLDELNILVLTDERVTRIEPHAVLTASGKNLRADLIVWAAGIKVAPVLGEIGLPVNKIGQVPVRQTLQTEIDDNIFALGDCASCPWPEHNATVPPRAQAAHQQANFLFDAIGRRIDGKALPAFRFRDQGSLVSLGRFNTIGNLMGRLTGRTLLIEGLLARLLYVSLYRAHLVTLHGFLRTVLDTMAQWLRGKTVPRIKLH
ncbi:NADH dehydrogenase [Actimicrobium sp. GrIS 1.19]|uniref:NAD(P)/FAD-dependent oxidoreductase n=1 Tax=Actimicrobium sp. GrIS 1.19 TaxID=3071708 RepID=UPI002E072651|nr:NADH dehydrogenase [Actimicrobium sp. GrIS 1.19]